MKRSEMAKRVEDFIDDLMIEFEPEELEEAAEQLRSIVDNYLDDMLTMQARLNEMNRGKS